MNDEDEVWGPMISTARALEDWAEGGRWTGSINYDAQLYFYRSECPRSASDLDGL